jgi:serine/threonine protein kinase
VIGKTLGHYQITSQLGKGGMGEVYQAQDQKLGRDVAIKVLPEEFAKDADRVARFKREARVLASLNHPNIAAIYGLEESAGTNFLVLEFVGGETLADQIKRGPLPVEESLKLSLQIAEALEAAHEKGVIHRDLKPANIKVTPDGKVKVLDFGLAKAFAGEQAEANLSNSPTLSIAATQQGIILGTAAYMSPEQARGKAIDKRTDVWAFGCVLYEMLAGQAAFQGDDITDILAAVVRAEPEWVKLPPAPQWRLLEMLERCLAKEAKNRYHDIADVRIEIQKILSDPKDSVTEPVGFRKRPLMPVLGWSLILFVIGVALSGLLFRHSMTTVGESPKLKYLNLNLPEDVPIAPIGVASEGVGVTSIALSADGKLVVYVGRQQGSVRLYRRPIDRSEVVPIAGTEGAYNPFFSPDGRWVAFFAEGKLKKVSLQGGEPISLCEVAHTSGGTWTSDDRIIFSDQDGGVISWIAATGGKAAQSFSPGGRWPESLPNGKAVLVSVGQAIDVITLPSGARKKLPIEGIVDLIGTIRYIPSGHIVFTVPGRLYAVPFDLDRLEISGQAFPVLDHIRTEAYTQSAQFAISNDETLVYLPGTSLSIGQLAWVDLKGIEKTLQFPPAYYGPFSIAPDGHALAVGIFDGKWDIWIYDLERNNRSRLTHDGNSDLPIWSPDGQWIVFRSTREGITDIYRQRPDGEDEERLTTDGESAPLFFSPDGKELFLDAKAGHRALSVAGTRNSRAFQSNGWLHGLSPDGRYLLYSDQSSGRYEVYVEQSEGEKNREKISIDGGLEARWSPAGDVIYYHTADRWIAVPVKTKPKFSAGTPHQVFEIKHVGLAGMDWDIAPDGYQFLIVKDINKETTATQLNIILNWFEELKQKVPVK